ncbi:MAG TPA: hypothetical protein VE733_30420 [Streptosporangiaceae bacterium]|nr:hypothetical protein [Streptosporangiaceae bacterium]
MPHALAAILALSQKIIRDDFLPEFGQLTMWESPPGGGSAYYTDNASAEVLANLGIYLVQSPGAQLKNLPAGTVLVRLRLPALPHPQPY